MNGELDQDVTAARQRGGSGVLRTLAAMLAVAALLAYAVHGIGLDRLAAPWRRVDPDLLVMAAAAQVLSYLARAARLAQSETAIGWQRLGPCLRLVLVHNAANILLPLRSGELSFVWLMQRRFSIAPLRATGTLLWLRLSDLLVLACCALLAAALHSAMPPPLAVAAALALALLLPALLFHAAAWTRRQPRLPRWLQQLAHGFPAEAGRFRDTLLWSWLGWALKLGGLAVLFGALAQASPALGVLVAIGGDLSTVLPVHAPGGLGTYEAAALAAAAPWQTPTAQLASAVIGLHAFLLGTALSLGLAAAVAGIRGAR